MTHERVILLVVHTGATRRLKPPAGSEGVERQWDTASRACPRAGQ